MTRKTELDERYQSCLADLSTRGQQHVLRWWDELSPDGRRRLLADVESIPWVFLDRLMDSHVLSSTPKVVPTGLQPPKVWPQCPGPDLADAYDAAREIGRELIASGSVAAFTVAGGQGSRLGFDGPKGAVEVTPAGSRTLFEIFGLTVAAAQRKYGAVIPWYVMTSPANHQETVEFFSGHDYFGLSRDNVMLFSQGMLPAFDFQGRLVLEAKDRLALAPDGHGGSLTALIKSGALADMRSRGVSIISYFQVDNPLVKPFDPLFLGLHRRSGSEMSTKVAPKADDLERVGNVCMHDGCIVVIEYSDFPEDCAHARDADGRRKFDAGNLAMHALDVDFVDRVVGRSFQLPVRRAEKKVAFLDSAGITQQPSEPNAVKLETFIFDVLPLASGALLLEVDREEEFSPVKNAEGSDSLATSRRDQNARACRWLAAAGVEIPRKPNGEVDITVALSPLIALDAEDLKARVSKIPPLTAGQTLYIE